MDEWCPFDLPDSDFLAGFLENLRLRRETSSEFFGERVGVSVTLSSRCLRSAMVLIEALGSIIITDYRSPVLKW